MKYLLTISLLFIIAGCGLRTRVLPDGITRIPVDNTVFRNRGGIPPALLAGIDTSVLYEELHPVAGGFMPARTDTSRYSDAIYIAYRFYGNGTFNCFVLDRGDTRSPALQLAPAHSGYRGVLYERDGNLYGDLAAQVSGIGTMGILRKRYAFRGDTLLIWQRHVAEPDHYARRALPPGVLGLRGYW